MYKHVALIALISIICTLPIIAQVQWQKAPGPLETYFSYLTHSQGIWYATGYEVQYSTDDGLTWQKMPGTEFTYDINSSPFGNAPGMSEMHVSGSTAFLYLKSAVSDGQVLLTNNGNDANWTPVPFVAGGSIANQCMVQYGDTVVALAVVSNEHQLAYSTNAGADWTPKAANQGWGILNGLYRSDNGNLYVISNAGDLWISEDTGDTWTRIFKANTTLPFKLRDVVLFGDVIVGEGGNVNKSAVSEDGGLTWQARPIMGDNFSNRIFDFDGALLYVSIDYDSSYVSPDFGQNWTLLPMAGLPGGSGLKIVNGTMLAIGNDRFLYRSTDAGQSFQKVEQAPITPHIFNFARSGDTWFVETGSRFQRSADAGQTWSDIDLPITLTLHIIANGDTVIAANYSKVFYSTDKGLTWQEQGLSAPTNNLVLKDNVIFYNFDGNKVYRHTLGTGGPSQTFPLPFIDQSVYYHTFELADSNMLLGGAESYALRSSDLGNTWENISDSAFLNKPIIGGAILYGYDYLAVNYDLYRRSHSGGVWEKIGMLPATEDDPTNTEIKFYQRGDQMLAFAMGEGAYVSPDSGATWVQYPGLPGPGRLQTAYVDSSLIALCMSGGLFYTTEQLQTNYYGGLVFVDDNQNGVRDSTERLLPEILIGNVGGDQTSSTNTDGHYRFFFAAPDSVSAIGVCKYCQVVPAGYQVNVPGDAFHFAVQSPPGITDYEVSLTNVQPVRPGFEADFVLAYRNVGTDSSTSTVQVTLPNYFTFVNATPPPDGVAGNTFTWHLPALLPFNVGQVNLRLALSSAQPLLSEVIAVADLATALPDQDTADNNDTLRMTVVGSFDPNDKSVSPVGPIDVERLDDSLTLTYTIRFQNTGTYPAEVVRVVDTLPTEVDLRTLHIIAASHPMQWQLEESRVLTFRFANIDLPDSSHNEMASHGFVKFRVQARPGLHIGDSIANRAGIYFDYNAPVITNKAVNSVVEIVTVQNPAVSVLDFEILPTLASQSILLKNKMTEVAKVAIVKVSGEIALTTSLLPINSQTIDVSGWTTGVYFVKIIFSSGRTGTVAIVKIN